MRIRLFVCFAFLLAPLFALADDKPLVPLNVPVNSDDDEAEPHVADAGLTLYFSSSRKGKAIVLLSQRKGAVPWPKKTTLIDDYVSAKGDLGGLYATQGRYPHYLYFAAKDDKGKNYDLYVAVKQDADRVWSSPTPVMNVNTAEDEAHPWMAFDGKSLYFSRKTKDGWKVCVSTRKAVTGPGGWGEPKELDLPAGYHHATLTPDGKTMYLQGPLEKGRWGLFMSKWDGKEWSKPEELKALNDAKAKTGDRSPNLSRDGKFLYFASDREGGKGGMDLWVIDTGKLGKK